MEIRQRANEPKTVTDSVSLKSRRMLIRRAFQKISAVYKIVFGGQSMAKFFILLSAAVFAATMLPTSGRAQTASQPILRLETGMHTAIIRRIGVDRAGRFLVTAADDKTARVWDIATGKLLRVLRVPIGAGNEGKLYAVALSPDGSTVAVGGQLPDESGKSTSIYLFDRADGRMTRRIGNLPNVVFHLAFAPDGKRLAATLFGGNGVRVFDISDGRQTGADSDYGSHSYGADFAADGKRLVTSC